MRASQNSRHRRERGALLGIVLILLVLILAASGFSVWTLRGETSSAGRDRMSRELFACAEQGLAWGKQYFGTAPVNGQWNSFLNANVCSAPGSKLPCAPSGPFPTGNTGQAPTGYPGSAPFTSNVGVLDANGNTITVLTYQIGIYNNPENPASPSADTDGQVVVYSKCWDPSSSQVRVVQAILLVTQAQSNDYGGQAGHGFRNQGNENTAQ